MYYILNEDKFNALFQKLIVSLAPNIPYCGNLENVREIIIRTYEVVIFFKNSEKSFRITKNYNPYKKE